MTLPIELVEGAEWGASLPAEVEGLVDLNAGQAVRWIEGQGWVEEKT